MDENALNQLWQRHLTISLAKVGRLANSGLDNANRRALLQQALDILLPLQAQGGLPHNFSTFPDTLQKAIDQLK